MKQIAEKFCTAKDCIECVLVSENKCNELFSVYQVIDAYKYGIAVATEQVASILDCHNPDLSEIQYEKYVYDILDSIWENMNEFNKSTQEIDVVDKDNDDTE